MNFKAFNSASGTQINPLGLAALAGIVVVGVVCAITIPPAVALYKNPPKRAESPRVPGKVSDQFGDALALSTDRFDGRSLFFVPGPPAITKDDGPKATVYGGPSLLAYVNGTAWFSDGQKISEQKPEDRTLKLVKANPPWSVRVLWQGGEFDVELFKRIEISTLRNTTNASLKPSAGALDSSASRPLFGAPELPRRNMTGGMSPQPGTTNLPPEAIEGPGAREPSTGRPAPPPGEPPTDQPPATTPPANPPPSPSEPPPNETPKPAEPAPHPEPGNEPTQPAPQPEPQPQPDSSKPS